MSDAKAAYILDPVSTAVYAALHGGCLLVFIAGDLHTGLAVGLASYIVRIFFLTAAYHRYFAHRSYRTSRALQFILGLMGTLAMQRGPLWWAATHRTHHRYSDTVADLHSPRFQGFVYSHSLWFLDKRNIATDYSAVMDLAKFPELRWLDNEIVYLPWVALYGIGLFLLFGLSGFVWGFFVSTVLIHHTTHWVQSMSHSIGGYRRFDTADESRNHWLLGVVSLGEFHNNHHFRASSARQGVAWWELDLAYVILSLMRSSGLIWSLKNLFWEIPGDRPVKRRIRSSSSNRPRDGWGRIGLGGNRRRLAHSLLSTVLRRSR
jgi:stearoyl-CoA desaturase (delta-9 desaturase)